MAQHFHNTKSRYEAGGGGIYCWASPQRDFPNEVLVRNQYQWVAQVDPLGDTEEHDYLNSKNIVRAAGVHVRSIATYDGLGNEISTGYVVVHGYHS